MRIGLGWDHAGVELAREIAEHLRVTGHEVDEIAPSTGADDDYPPLAVKLGEAVATGRVTRGIFCCGSGIGPAVAANKLAGVRAAVVSDEWSARDAVEHVDVNFLTLGGRVVGGELAKAIVDAYLGATAHGGRHARRREQIADLEKEKVK